MSLYDQILRNDPKYTEAHRRSDGRGEPWASGFGRRLYVEPKKADRWMLWLAIGAVVFTVILTLTGAVR